MKITTEQALINKGREILESHLEDIQRTPGYLGWRIQEAVDFLPRKNKEIEVRSLFLLVKVDGDAIYKDVASHIEQIEEKAYKEFADLVVEHNIEGKVNIFILMDFEEI